MDRRIAAVFYLDVKYGTKKGSINVGDDMLNAKTGHHTSKSGRRYAMARVVDELIGYGNGSHSFELEFNHVINFENIKIEEIDDIGTADEVRVTLATGVGVGTGCSLPDATTSSTIIDNPNTDGTVTGTIDQDGTGTLEVAGLEADSADVPLYITYDYQYDMVKNDDGDVLGVPETDVGVTQSTVEAIDFPLRAKYSIGAQIDLMKAHGIDLESELVKYLGSEIKFTIDQVGLDMIDEAAGSTDAADNITSWDARPGLGEPWIWKKEELLDRFQQGSNNIFEKTKRGVATFIHCGNNVARVIKQLNKWKPRGGATQNPTGPMVIGDIDGLTVVQNPFKKTNYYTMGYRGPSYLYAGFIYAPYIPLFTTPTLITSDLMAQKGFLSSAGFKVINAGLFCEGYIENLGGAGVDNYQGMS